MRGGTLGSKRVEKMTALEAANDLKEYLLHIVKLGTSYLPFSPGCTSESVSQNLHVQHPIPYCNLRRTVHSSPPPLSQFDRILSTLAIICTPLPQAAARSQLSLRILACPLWIDLNSSLSVIDSPEAVRWW
jgi:hypothetical protein